MTVDKNSALSPVQKTTSRSNRKLDVMNFQFFDEINQYDQKEVLEQILDKKPSDVEEALHSDRLSMDGFQALISPAAEKYLEPMAVRAHEITKQRFGNNILMYVPIYLSNECTNGCVYCGFNACNNIDRKTLSESLRDWILS